uniref:Uncharacterized protein n=1 Tax=Marseillevirus LCMAC101 TaxID=2506602 RepID=A0A481YSB8_9VIRU|nr:MAG: hypothetical protein LCMAC101_07170 [Marseillevirus LCMAC101]
MVEPLFPDFSVSRDATLNNLNVTHSAITNLTNIVLGTSTVNDGLQYDDIQQQVKLNNHRNFMIDNTITQLTVPLPLPTFPGGRTVTFNNMTSATTLDIYVTEGYPNAKGATIIPGGSAVAPGAPGVVWPIPTTAGWNGNFTMFPTGDPVTVGASLAEFGFNQLWSGAVPPLRDTFDISTVPPGIGTLCSDGPHGFPPPFPPKPHGSNPNCVYFSLQSKFSTQQSQGYNVGMRIIPPAGSLMFATVTCTQSNGDSPDSVGYPNDTAFPKQQTIELTMTGSYTVDLLDPVLALP